MMMMMMRLQLRCFDCQSYIVFYLRRAEEEDCKKVGCTL